MKPTQSPEQEIIYHIDGMDRLCSVSADWTQFALANDGSALLPERVLGRPLWDFIEDDSVRELYRQIVHRARSGHPAQFDYRCDAPEWCRRFRMTIRSAADGTVEFLSQLLWKERRPRMGILDIRMPRGELWVRVCSWCQNVALPDGSWVSVEEAVGRLDLLAEEALPKLTHGICPPCHKEMTAHLAPSAAVLRQGHAAQAPGVAVADTLPITGSRPSSPKTHSGLLHTPR